MFPQNFVFVIWYMNCAIYSANFLHGVIEGKPDVGFLGATINAVAAIYFLKLLREVRK